MREDSERERRQRIEAVRKAIREEHGGTDRSRPGELTKVRYEPSGVYELEVTGWLAPLVELIFALDCQLWGAWVSDNGQEVFLDFPDSVEAERFLNALAAGWSDELRDKVTQGMAGEDTGWDIMADARYDTCPECEAPEFMTVVGLAVPVGDVDLVIQALQTVVDGSGAG